MKLSFHSRAVIGPAIALAVNLLLLVAILASLGEDLATVSDKGGWNAGLSVSIGSAFSRKPIESYKQVLAKPVFFRSREPFVLSSPQPPVTAVAPAPVIEPSVVLGGIMINDSARKAYVFGRNGTGGEWIVEGGDFMGWRIGSINGSGAKLEQGGRSIDLQLYPRE